jgi:hypothetical protein
MASKSIENFAAALDERAGALAAAPDTDAVKTVIDAAKAEAVRTSVIPDTYVYRLTVTVLGLAVLSVIAAQLWITLDDSNVAIPAGIIAIGSAAIGALAGLLAPVPTS